MFYLDHIEVSIKFLLDSFSGGQSGRMKVPLGQVRPFIMQHNQMFSFKLFFFYFPVQTLSCPGLFIKNIILTGWGQREAVPEEIFHGRWENIFDSLLIFVKPRTKTWRQATWSFGNSPLRCVFPPETPCETPTAHRWTNIRTMGHSPEKKTTFLLDFIQIIVHLFSDVEIQDMYYILYYKYTT